MVPGMRSRMEVQRISKLSICGRPEHIRSFCEIADQLRLGFRRGPSVESTAVNR